MLLLLGNFLSPADANASISHTPFAPVEPMESGGDKSDTAMHVRIAVSSAHSGLPSMVSDAMLKNDTAPVVVPRATRTEEHGARTATDPMVEGTR